jgi:hypothetical protein
MADTVQVRGLRDYQKALRDIEPALGPELRKALNEVAEIVASDARSLVPARSGKARSSIKAGSSQRAAQIKVGGTKAPYFPWLDFGGRVGRQKSVKRPFIQEGRYIYPTLRRRRDDVEEKLFDVLGRLAEHAGLGKID